VTVRPRAPSRIGSHAGAVREPVALWTALARARAATVVHRSAGPEAGLIALWCRAARCRFVYSASSTIDFTFETLGARDTRLHRLGLHLADRIVVQSDEQAALAATVADPARVVIIPSIAEQAPLAGTGEAFVWAGGAASYKRPGELLDLAEAVPEARFVMVLAGRDDRVAQRAARLPNVELHGALPRAELLERLDRAIAIVNTSEFEGMPNTFLEAWARGVPALSLAIDPDGLLAGRGLGITADGDRNALAAAARTLWERRAGGNPAIRAFVEDQHAPAAVAARWRELLA
jgi:glycosyltransferase involved in cell wall biosynthesis